MNFTGGQFRYKYEIEPRTWSKKLHSVTEYFYFAGLISSKLLQIIYYKNGVKMMRGLIKYSLWVCLFGLSFGLVDYNSEIQPIFNSACTSCHGSSAGLDLSSYNNIMMGSNNGDVVIPYDHASSELWVRVNSGQMPPGNNDLTDEQVDLIAQWIDEGALEEPGSSSGCTDPEAYNCADDDSWENYIFDIGGTMYDNSCNWDWNLDVSEAEYVGGCESGPCVGYYNPGASTDDGSCRYYHAPHGNEVVFAAEDDGISIDWSAFIPPVNAVLESYHVQRCLEEGCSWMPGFGISPTEPPNTNTLLFDEFDWEAGVEIKYAIAVKYENNPYWGWAIGASYITPLWWPGDMNGDGGWNVLDIVALANCVLAANCGGIEGGLPADMNGDGNYNVLDIVALANCVLADNCGG
ncbi:MAG: c-type cytochrome domain-containing protein [Candidatus Marinimicrobia bacterium]|nr:c-type cytochrome domain-containing protein [Candidatus Neomarinimicrobiota bacterium]